MASTAIRGSEATLTITVGTQKFTMLTKSFRRTPDFELKKDDYTGQRTSLPNPQFNGVDFSWECDEDDSQALELTQLLLAAEESGLAPPEATIHCRYKYRKAGVAPRVELLSKCTLKPGGREVSGRKENVSTSFEGFSPTRPKLLSL
jgi:hypothetical protein